ncbi:UNVERIFIED_CONTAM: hypothetical protein GTU68_065299 [Idotea baltica]|nr:hypothetical protein [Idotea baltica]
MDFPTPDGSFRALENVNLKVKKGEFVSIIGHSGCGKSTVLNVVAGLYQATAGGILLNDKEVTEPGPERAMVFQNHSLLPWLTAYENVELAMEHALNKRPDEISGGMKQRVGIARALAMEPEVLLLDEPFGALDALTRAHLQDSVMEIQADLGNTMMMVTHDVDEAVLLSDRIVMMTNGPAATVGEILEVNLPKIRERIAISESKEYNHCRHEVLRFLYERHGKKSEELVEQTTDEETELDNPKVSEVVDIKLATDKVA